MRNIKNELVNASIVVGGAFLIMFIFLAAVHFSRSHKDSPEPSGETIAPLNDQMFVRHLSTIIRLDTSMIFGMIDDRVYYNALGEIIDSAKSARYRGDDVRAEHYMETVVIIHKYLFRYQ